MGLFVRAGQQYKCACKFQQQRERSSFENYRKFGKKKKKKKYRWEFPLNILPLLRRLSLLELLIFSVILLFFFVFLLQIVGGMPLILLLYILNLILSSSSMNFVNLLLLLLLGYKLIYLHSRHAKFA